MAGLKVPRYVRGPSSSLYFILVTLRPPCHTSRQPSVHVEFRMTRRTCPSWSAVLCLAAAVLACPRVATAQSGPCPEESQFSISFIPASQTVAPGATVTLTVNSTANPICVDFYWYERIGDHSQFIMWGTNK